MSDREAIDELRRAGGGKQEADVLHYLYFPTEEAARVAEAAIVGGGEFAVEVRLGADDVNWLVLARHRVVPDEAQIEHLRAMFEALASAGSGEYDGWEAEVV